jgi:hypothetical protein
MKKAPMSFGILVLTLFLSGAVHADDIADVKAAENAFNAAQNAGSIAGMAKFFLPGRTIFGPSGGGLGVGWTEDSLARRQAEFDAGRKIDYRIEKLDVRLHSGTAVSTFERVGTVKEIGSAPRDSHLRITGVWVKVDGRES